MFDKLGEAMTSWLILVPTAIELQHLPIHFLKLIESKGGAIELCGFGPIVAAARTAALIAQHSPQQVVLCGVAGAIGNTLRIAEASCFGAVGCYGVGVGCGPDQMSAASMGWRHWSGDGDGLALSMPIGDVIELHRTRELAQKKLLISSCAASQNESDVAIKLATYPTAVAEDMEGFAVAAACQLAGVPLVIVRGISNRAGDRDHRNWKLAEAMLAAVALVEEMIEL